VEREIRERERERERREEKRESENGFPIKVKPVVIFICEAPDHWVQRRSG